MEPSSTAGRFAATGDAPSTQKYRSVFPTARASLSLEAGKVSVMGFDGGQYGPIGNTPVDGTYRSFSPDGTQVVFERV